MVQPRFASTVVLLRPDANGRFEILLTRRPLEMRFMGGCYVFPGGALHPSDYSAAVLERCRGLSGKEARRLLGNRHEPEVALGHWVAVIRELFEEVGVLLCESATKSEVDFRDRETRRRFEAKRRELVAERSELDSLLNSEDLYCDLARIVYFFHRVTPGFYPVRFDTRFFLAALPRHQNPLPRTEEVTESLWIGPHEALARARREDFPLFPPTTTVLETLAHLERWDRLRMTYGLP